MNFYTLYWWHPEKIVSNFFYRESPNGVLFESIPHGDIQKAHVMCVVCSVWRQIYTLKSDIASTVMKRDETNKRIKEINQISCFSAYCYCGISLCVCLELKSDLNPLHVSCVRKTLIMSELYGVCISTLKMNAYIIFAKIIWPAEYLLSIIVFAAVLLLPPPPLSLLLCNMKAHTHIHVNTT